MKRKACRYDLINLFFFCPLRIARPSHFGVQPRHNQYHSGAGDAHLSAGPFLSDVQCCS